MRRADLPRAVALSDELAAVDDVLERGFEIERPAILQVETSLEAHSEVTLPVSCWRYALETHRRELADQLSTLGVAIY